jgi:hypothetical protein
MKPIDNPDIFIMETFLTYSVLITTLPRDKGTSISIKYSMKSDLIKPSISQQYEARQGNDTGYGLCFWKGRVDKN